MCDLMNTLTISADNLIQIGSVVSVIWPGEVKGREGGARLSRRVYSAKYSSLTAI